MMQLNAAEQAKLGMRWLNFVIWVRCPLTAFYAVGPFVLLALLPETSLLRVVSLLEFWIALGFAMFSIRLGMGLYRRERWAWSAYIILLFFEAILAPGNPFQSGRVHAGGLYLAAMGVVLLFWVWPNFIYFKKRRHLFSRPFRYPFEKQGP